MATAMSVGTSKAQNVKLKIAISGGLYPPLIVDH